MVLKIIQYYILLNLVNVFSLVMSDGERIKTKSKKYILTIFEKRVNPEELPFFMSS